MPGPRACFSASSSASCQHAYLWFATIEASGGGFHKVLADTGHSVIGLDTGLFEQRLGSQGSADGLQVSKGVHRELEGGTFLQERFAALLGQDNRHRIEHLGG